LAPTQRPTLNPTLESTQSPTLSLASLRQGCIDTVNSFNLDPSAKEILDRSVEHLLKSLSPKDTETLIQGISDVNKRGAAADLLLERTYSDEQKNSSGKQIREWLLVQLGSISLLKPEATEEFVKRCLEDINSSTTPTKALTKTPTKAPTTNAPTSEPTRELGVGAFSPFIAAGVIVVIFCCGLYIRDRFRNRNDQQPLGRMVELESLESQANLVAFNNLKEDHDGMKAFIGTQSEATVLHCFRNAEFSSQGQFVGVINQLLQDESLGDDKKSAILSGVQANNRYKINVNFEVIDRLEGKEESVNYQAAPPYELEMKQARNSQSMSEVETKHERNSQSRTNEVNPPSYGMLEELTKFNGLREGGDYNEISAFIKDQKNCEVITHCIQNGTFVSPDNFRVITSRLLGEYSLDEKQKLAIISGVKAQDQYPFKVEITCSEQEREGSRRGSLSERKGDDVAIAIAPSPDPRVDIPNPASLLEPQGERKR
jgi:hypothetical protein